MHKVTNCLATSLVIEDIGIRLEANESKQISSYAYLMSKKICEYEKKKWVHVHIVTQPLSNTAKYAPIQQIVQQPVHVENHVPVRTEPQKIDLSALNTIVSKLETIVNSIQFQSVERATGTTTQTIQTKSNEPIFIPSKIMPDTAEVRIKVATTESESLDFDSSLKALRGMKKA